jgi:hypothetical protein
MDNAFGYAFVVEMKNFLTENKVFQERRSAFTRAKTVLIIRYWRSVIGCKQRGGEDFAVGTFLRFGHSFAPSLVLAMKFSVKKFMRNC